MKIDLMEFQEIAVQELLKAARHARAAIAADGIAQALVLSSPTGSGKTVTVTALLERILRGDDSLPPDPEAVFLWLSDSPELNSQSRDKMIAQSDVFREHELVIVESSFSRERFEPGKVYFLNTQKLGRDNLLTKTGDGREFTIWQTIENTGKAGPEHFYLVIDEAHRGMNLTARQLQQAQTIVQKFIFGDPGVGLSPFKLIVGISATTERFERILHGSNRTRHMYTVPFEAVRLSGLLKDRIVLFCPKGAEYADWTLLAEAAKRWRRTANEWRKYCKTQGIPPVDPILVIQVEDAAGGRLTRTDLTQAVQILEREAGHFGLGELAHCFEEAGDVPECGYQIRKIEPSKIQQDALARVVFFKMALSTGWDCPRAEVMMSFRKAKDHTSIAQLVGRMVRTPLARRIEGSELLNSVSLYLPHYDKVGLRAIVDKLNDPENAPPTEVVEGGELVTLKRNPKYAEAFDLLAGMPSYSFERAPKTTNTKRFVKLARQLTLDEIDPKAWNEAKALVIATLAGELERLRQDQKFTKTYKANQNIEVHEVQIESGEWKQIDDGRIIKVKASPENIDDLFDDCGRKLGEGLHREFWKEKSDRQDPQRAKLELFGVLQDEAARKKLEAIAGKRLDELFDEYREAIREQPTSKKEEYNSIRRTAKTPQTVSLFFPPLIEVRRTEPLWEHHLYVDDDGGYGWDANTWEAAVLNAEMDEDGFVAWLRNEPRKPWSLCVAYDRESEDRPLFPDLLVFRREKGKLRVDILDPHDSEKSDAVEKAKGLCKFAAKHGEFFGRIELITVGEHGEIKRLDVNREGVRERVGKASTTAYLNALFDGVL